MKVYVFWTAIAGPQYSVHEDDFTGNMQATACIKRFGYSHAYMYVEEDKEWTHYTNGVRSRVNACEIPEDEVPKVFKLLLTLES